MPSIFDESTLSMVAFLGVSFATYFSNLFVLLNFFHCISSSLGLCNKLTSFGSSTRIELSYSMFSSIGTPSAPKVTKGALLLVGFMHFLGVAFLFLRLLRCYLESPLALETKVVVVVSSAWTLPTSSLETLTSGLFSLRHSILSIHEDSPISI